MSNDYCDPHYPHFNQQQKKTMITKDQETEGAAFARGPAADVFGKLDAELQAIRFDSETLLKLHRDANELGVSITEYCRTTLRVKAWGEAHVETVNLDHLRRIIGNAGRMRGETA